MCDGACPNCGNSDNISGYEVTGLYDGVLYWGCDTCGICWPIDFGASHQLTQASREYASRRRHHNRNPGRTM